MIPNVFGLLVIVFILGFFCGVLMIQSIKKDEVKAGVMEFRRRIYRVVDVTDIVKSMERREGGE